MSSRFDRALADLVGGYEGGYALWLVALMRLDLAAGDARDFDRFHAYPEGAWNRLLSGIDAALRTGELGVELERMLADHGDHRSDPERRDDVAELLMHRARELADARQQLSPTEWERYSPRNHPR